MLNSNIVVLCRIFYFDVQKVLFDWFVMLFECYECKDGK